jgi:N-acetylmuramoyl-L-alanine amidase/Fibronectin type III domain
MRRRLPFALLAALLSFAASTPGTAATAFISLSPDYPPANWIPASSANYSVANRPQDYNVDMIVIHDTEGSYADAIAQFQDPIRAGSAHYVVSSQGDIAQMVLEKNIAWHAGNWDYNTRAIGIEHEGSAYVAGSFTTLEYRASEQLAASICSRWGVPLDRQHVIGHNVVPDPNDPSLFGGTEHHTDPGPYWDWTNYLIEARNYAAALPSPPHIGPDPVAVSKNGGVMLSWSGHSCHNPIDSYQVVSQPAGITLNLAGTVSSVWIPGLTNGVSYTFTVTAHNSDGQASLTSKAVVPGLRCSTASLSAGGGSPQPAGASIVFSATAGGCNTAEYAFWVEPQGGSWALQRDYGAASWTWNTAGLAPGTYELGVWARQLGSAHPYDAYGWTTLALRAMGCASTTLTPDLAPPRASGATINFTASSTGCSSPQYQFWLQGPNGGWIVEQAYGVGASWAWNTTGLAAGNYWVGVWARQTGSTSSYDSFYVSTFWISPGAGCVTTGLSPSVASPQTVGATLTFTPQQTGCTHQYKFWILPPGGSWQVVQAYGVGGTWVWNTAGYPTGTYEVGVWEGSSTTPAYYESYAITSFALGASACTSAALSPSPGAPQGSGATVTLSASATGCGNPQYQFWLLSPGGGWIVKQSYGAAASWSWNTTGMAPGTYQVGVWARQSGSGASYDAYFIGTYQLAVANCTSAALSASPMSPQAAGTKVTFTASSTGCAAPQYQFWRQMPSGSWSLVQGYGTGATFTWDSTGAAPGTYSFAVWAAAAGSPNTYDQYLVTTFSIA